VIVWDENDYSVEPTTNQVALVVDTNDQDGYGLKSDRQSGYGPFASG
jgi:hypothetical protein